MHLEESEREKLWPVLVEVVHALVLYPSHKAYAREIVLHENPQAEPEELAARLGMPVGEALVILSELAAEKKAQSPDGAGAK